MPSRRHHPPHRRRRNRSRWGLRGTVGLIRSLGDHIPAAALRSSALLLIGRAFPQFGIFTAGVLVARAVGPRSYGLYSATFALGSLTVGGATAGLSILLLRRASEGDLDRPTLKRAAGLQLGFSAVAIVVTAGLSSIVFGGLNGALVGIAASLFFAANNFATLGQYVQAGSRRYHRAAATDIAAGTLFPIFTYIALRLHTGINGSLVAIAAACSISCSIAWTGLPKLQPEHPPSRLRVFDGMSFTALGLVTAGYGRVDTVTLAHVAGGAAAGYYAAAYRLLGPFDLVGSAMVTVYFSRLSEYKGNRERWRTVRRRGTFLLVLIASLSAIVLFVAAPRLIRLFYGAHYQQSVVPARILLLSVVPWSLYWLRPADLASVRLERRATTALGAGFVLDLLLVAAVGGHFGPAGTAWAWVATETFMLVVLSFSSRRIIERVGHPDPAMSPARGNETLSTSRPDCQN
jgi:O-antigen/teichoic acid export membrane protein